MTNAPEVRDIVVMLRLNYANGFARVITKLTAPKSAFDAYAIATKTYMGSSFHPEQTTAKEGKQALFVINEPGLDLQAAMEKSLGMIDGMFGAGQAAFQNLSKGQKRLMLNAVVRGGMSTDIVMLAPLFIHGPTKEIVTLPILENLAPHKVYMGEETIAPVYGELGSLSAFVKRLGVTIMPRPGKQ